MKSFGIRARILLAALAPATLVTFLVSGLLASEHVRQVYIDQHLRLSAVARQIAAAAEYNLFVGNDEALARLMEAAIREPDVVAAAFLDNQGRVLVSSVPVADLPAPGDALPDFSPATRAENIRHWHSLTIRATNYGEIDLFAGTDEPSAPVLGQLLLKVSNESLHERMWDYAFKSVASSALMLTFGVLLALVLSRGLIRTLGDIAHVIDGIRHGRRDLRVENTGRDELGQLGQGINAMADAVGQTQEALAARIAEATATLRRERDEAAEAAQARSRFFAAASHDLRQPLQALSLFVTRLARDARTTPLHPQVAQVVHSVRSLQNLLDTLLDYSRLSGKTFQVSVKPVSATKFLEHVIDELAPLATEKNLGLRHRIADCWLLTDQALLYRVIANLLSNAIRHTRRGAVLVTCRRGKTHARIEIWDTGPGIPPEHHEAIFEELVQLDNPERDATKGLGLGLAIVRRTAMLLGHPVSVCSRVGQGSRFSIAVPLAPAHPGDAQSPGATAIDNPLEDARILLVANRQNAQDELAVMLDSWGCIPAVVADADAARDRIAERGAPDAILWDVAGGASDVDRVRETLGKLEAGSGCRLPAILICNGPVPPPAERAGGTPCLLISKPFRSARLRALLSHLLTMREEPAP